MPRAGHFKQTDVTKVVRAARKAGVRRVRCEIEPSGKITLVCDGDEPGVPANPWDREFDDA